MATIKINLTIPESNANKRAQIRTGIVATAIHKETGHKYSAIFNSSTYQTATVNITVSYTGTYIIKYNNPNIYGNSEVEILNTNSTITIQAQYSDLVTYTLCINEINKECYYLDDATKINFNNLNYIPIFQDIKPCKINNNGTITILNNLNYIQSEYNDENIMIQIPKFAYKIYRKNNYLYISITNNKEVALADRRFSYDAFTKETEGDLDYFYIGAYKGFIDNNNKLRSIVGKQPTANKTLEEFKTAAQTNGSRYSITKYSHLKALQCLLLIRYGTFDLLKILGKGVSTVNYDIIDANLSFITGYDILAIDGITVENQTANNSSYDHDMQYSNTDSGLHHMRVFGIEDFWGNIFEWIDDFKVNENFIIQSGDTDTYPGIISANDFSSQSSQPQQLSDNLNLGLITRVAGTTETGFIPIEFNNNYFNNTHFDITIQSTGQYGMFMEGCNLAFGGMWNMGDKVGPFCMAADVDKNFQYRSVGARLVYA